MTSRRSNLESADVVTCNWLLDKIACADESIRVVDVRGYVKTAEVEGVQSADYLGARQDYLHEHIPGAVYIDWTTDIVDLDQPVAAQAASADEFSSLMSRLGIGDNDLIVAYDSHPASQFATRLWWMCRLYGNSNVRVLSGGWPAWKDAGHPVSTIIPKHPRASFTAVRHPEWIANADQMLEIINKPGDLIVDARDSAQFTGKVRRGSRGGHIPGAVNIPREALFSSPGVLKSSDELASALEASNVQLAEFKRVTAYCNGGVAATSVLFALSILGFTSLRNYDGSWNEWSELASMPVQN